jgi:hypothetical protein
MTNPFSFTESARDEAIEKQGKEKEDDEKNEKK